MQGQKVLFVGGQGPVSAPALRLLAPDNDVFAMARFSKPEVRNALEALGVTCIAHDMFEPFDDLPDDFEYVFHSALPLVRNAAGRIDVPERGAWPDSFDAYADATGRLMAHFRPAKGFLFASSISVYDPPGGDTPVPETHPYGIHLESAYAFTKVANEAVISFLSRSLGIPTTIIRVGSASGVDGGPMHDRLDRIVQGRKIRLHPDKPNYTCPLFEPDAAKLGVAALEAGRVPPLVVNWCGDEVVTVEDYCTYMGELVGKDPIFEYTPKTWCSLVPDTTFRREVLGPCETTWREGCRQLVEQCYPESFVEPTVDIAILLPTLVIFAEVAEGVRNTIAAYTQGLDDGRVDDVVATFCPDGVVEIDGMGTYEGHDALRQAYEGWKPRGPQRHVVANTLVTAWSDDEATAISDVIFMFKGDAGWQIFTVGRYKDTFHRDGDTWRFHRRAGSFVT